MDLNKYTENYLKLLYFREGSFDKVLANNKFEDEFKKSKFSSKIDFLCNCIGYSNDDNLSSSQRRDKRKELMENFSSPDYLRKEANSQNLSRTSKLVDSYLFMDVAGLGQEYVSQRSNKYSFIGLSNFINENKDLIKIFCDGAKIMDSNYAREDGTNYKVCEIANLMKSNSYKNFLKIAKSLKLDFSAILNVSASGECVYRDNVLNVPKNLLIQYTLEDLVRNLIYCYTIYADLVPLGIITFFKNYVEDFPNLFKMPTNMYLYLIDICYMCNCTGEVLLNRLGFSIPYLEDMENETSAIYLVNPNTNKVQFIPRCTTESNVFPCELSAEGFANCVNRELLNQINYVDGLPYLEMVPLFDGRG